MNEVTALKKQNKLNKVVFNISSVDWCLLRMEGEIKWYWSLMK
jgi:hypothetical protein